MLKLVEASKRIQWETFTNQNTFSTQFEVNVGAVTISESMSDMILSYNTWSGIRYLNDDGDYVIGYGIGDPDDQQGQTETDSYIEWIGHVRNKQKTLRNQLPIVNITQTVFDGLMSLYLDTGTWRTVTSNEGTYDLADAVRNGNWLLVADIISRGNVNPNRRQHEARVIQLADYSASKDRNQQIIQGIQKLRTSYVNGFSNDFDKTQAEFVYYRQLGVFLPNMSNLRQRRIVAQAVT